MGQFERRRTAAQCRCEPQVRAQRGEAERFQTVAIEACPPGVETFRIALNTILARERLQERDATAQFGKPGQAAVELARGQVMKHVAADEQVDRRAWAQVFEVPEPREVQVSARAEAADRIFAAVETEVLQSGTQFRQRGPPCALAAADIQYRAQRALEMVFGGGDRERDLAGEARGTADRLLAQRGVAVPALEIGGVVLFGHCRRHVVVYGRGILRAPTRLANAMNAYLWIKTFHLVFVIAWMAAVFYLPRILVNIAEAGNASEVRARLVLMGRRLYRFGHMMFGVAAVLGLVLWLGYRFIDDFPTMVGAGSGWLHAKLTLVVLLLAYFIVSGRQLKGVEHGRALPAPRTLRWLNELPVLVLVAIVYLVLAKPF